MESLDEAASVRRHAQAFYDFNLAESKRARDAADRTLSLLEGIAAAMTVLGVLLASVTWRRTSRDLVEPLQALHRAAEAVATGRFMETHHAASGKTIEIAGLQDAFNQMTIQLRDLTTRLRESNASLESEVAARTRALSDANQRLEGMVEDLRALDKVKSDFMAVMSHEPLTPINFITGFGTALEDGLAGPITPEQAEAVKKILEGADRLTRLVRNTLEYTQLEAGKLTVVPTEVDYSALVDQTVEAFRDAAAAKHLHVEVRLPDAVPEVWADPARVEQILRELLDNALKFTPEGGRIRVAVDVRPDCLVTEVVDTGGGIPDALMVQVSKPFFQADFSSTRAHGGLGLGLAIAYRLAALMGGLIFVSSRPGHGTTFRFTLPLSDQHMDGARQHDK